MTARLGMSNLAWAPGETAAALGMLARLGVEGIEAAPTRIADWDRLDAAAARGYRAEVEDAGLRVCSLQAILFGRPDVQLLADAAAFAALAEHMRQVAEVAEALGAGVAVLGAPLIVVLGHEGCGAVQAAVDIVQKDTSFPGSIGKMVEPIVPAVIRARRQGEENVLDRAVKENVLRVVERLKSTEQMLVEPQRRGTLKIVGARYDLDDGNVEFFE